MICKLSIVVPGFEDGGTILDTNSVPQIGDHLTIGDRVVEVMEVTELLPARGDFRFIHTTCRLVGEDGGRRTGDGGD